MKIPPGRVAFAELHPDVWLTRDELAEGLGLTNRQVERLGIPFTRLGHKTIRYRKGDVMAFLSAQPRQSSRRPRRAAEPPSPASTPESSKAGEAATC